MALFKYSGTSTELDQKVRTAGFVYATVDVDESNPGSFQNVAQWWIDIPSPDGETQIVDGKKVPVPKRYRMAAASLIDENGNVIEIDKLAKLTDLDDYVQTTDVIDVEHGGTNAGTAAEARANLDVYAKEEVDSAIEGIDDKVDTLTDRAYKGIIRSVSWSTTADERGFYSVILQLDSAAGNILMCGRDGNVPPSITINDRDDYGNIRTDFDDVTKAWMKIDGATAMPYEEGTVERNNCIIFYSKTNIRDLEVDIPVIITDYR